MTATEAKNAKPRRQHWVIAVCDKCGWWTRPMVPENGPPACVNCMRQSRKGLKRMYRQTITRDDLSRAPQMRFVTVVEYKANAAKSKTQKNGQAKKAPFTRRKP